MWSYFRFIDKFSMFHSYEVFISFVRFVSFMVVRVLGFFALEILLLVSSCCTYKFSQTVKFNRKMMQLLVPFHFDSSECLITATCTYMVRHNFSRPPGFYHHNSGNMFYLYAKICVIILKIMLHETMYRKFTARSPFTL